MRRTSLRKAEGIGRPLGTADFVIELERRLGRPIAPGSRAESRSDRAGRAAEFAAIGKLSVRQASWRVPAGASPAQVRLSRRLVVSVAWWKVTTTAKRTQQLCGVGY
jgi:hypothetical protein